MEIGRIDYTVSDWNLFDRAGRSTAAVERSLAQLSLAWASPTVLQVTKWGTSRTAPGAVLIESAKNPFLPALFHERGPGIVVDFAECSDPAKVAGDSINELARKEEFSHLFLRNFHFCDQRLRVRLCEFAHTGRWDFGRGLERRVVGRRIWLCCTIPVAFENLDDVDYRTFAGNDGLPLIAKDFAGRFSQVVTRSPTPTEFCSWLSWKAATTLLQPGAVGRSIYGVSLDPRLLEALATSAVFERDPKLSPSMQFDRFVARVIGRLHEALRCHNRPEVPTETRNTMSSMQLSIDDTGQFHWTFSMCSFAQIPCFNWWTDRSLGPAQLPAKNLVTRRDELLDWIGFGVPNSEEGMVEHRDPRLKT